MGEHINPQFLFIHGDSNLRHSIQAFGMLSWVDALILAVGSIFIVLSPIILGKKFPKLDFGLVFKIGIFGIIAGIIPSALTNEGNPHALRAIAAWPFFALLIGAIASELEGRLKLKRFFCVILCLSLINFGFYLRTYFIDYPIKARDSFKGMDFPLITAYHKMRVDNLTCSQLVFPDFPAMNTPIFFSPGKEGKQYLKALWHEPESWGVWSSDKISKILLPIPVGNPKELVLTMRSPITQLHTSNPLVLMVNQKQIIKLDLNKPTGNEVYIEIPKGFDHRKYLEIELNVLNPVKPKDIGLGADERTIGVGLEQAIFR